MKAKWLGAVALAALLGACGTDTRERTTGGAAAGAATGAGVGALGGPVGALAGAAIGGGAGAVTGAVTEPSTVNLGEPPWSNPEARVPGLDNNRSGSSSTQVSSTRDIQRALRDRGYDPGPVDGVWGSRSQRAARDFQRANGMAATGRATPELRAALNVDGRGTQTGSSNDPNRAYMGGGMVQGQSGSSGNTGGSSSGTMGTSGDRGMGMQGSTGRGSGAPSPGNVPMQHQGSMGTGGSGMSGPAAGGGSMTGRGGQLERQGTATDADPGTGGTGGSGGGASTAPAR